MYFRPRADDPRPLSERDTHRIPAMPENRLIADSRGRGWGGVYVSLAAERPWRARLAPLPHDCLVYCLAGKARIERSVEGADARQALLKPRMFSIIPADRASEWSVSGTPDILLVYLHARLKAELLPGMAPADAALTPKVAQFDPLLEQLSLALLACLRRQVAADPAYAGQLARTAVMHLATRHAAVLADEDEGADAPPAAIRRAIDHIHACPAEPLSVERLAQLAGTSVSRLVAGFKAHTGSTPYQYLLRTRIEQAKAWLVSTDRSVADIALDVGFATPSHFAATFRRLAGVAPTVYRDGN